MQFCPNCLAQLRTGKLKRYVCNANHDWLHVPKWDDEQYRKVGKGRVKIGGEFRDGARVGGEIVTIEEWLDLVRDDCGIPKPKKQQQPEQEQPC